MPSLENLEQFQLLMGEIGGQNEALASAGLPPEKIKLPDSEPAPRPEPRTDFPADFPPPPEPDENPGEPFSPENIPGFEEGGVEPGFPFGLDGDDGSVSEPFPADENELAAESEPPPFDFGDFGDLTASLPRDIPAPEPPDESPSDAAPPDESENDSNLNAFELPEDSSTPFPGPDNQDNDIADLNPEDFGISEDTASLDNAAPPDTGLDLSNFSGEFPGGEDIFLPGDAVPAEPDRPDNLEDINFPDIGENPAPPDTGPAGDDDSAPTITEQDISDEEKAELLQGKEEEAEPDETPEPDSAGEETPAPPEEPAGDGFDKFEFNPGSQDAGAALPDLEDFNLDGAPDAPGKAAPEKKAGAISFTEEQLQAMLETLAKYPLNIRIACEEIIAEQVVPPAQLTALTKLLINRGSAAEAARLAGKILEKKIVVPKGYQTGEDLEREQGSLGYIFLHKFFPVVRLFFLLALLAASISYLVWHFIVNPLIAENLYKKGYELIALGDPNEYQRANQYFSSAFEKHRVKEWFYKYAERFREEKQYLYAREKYNELLYYYPHDKQGALSYAAMEAYDQHNYEKADRLIRTEVLDYKIDDNDGLLALGDTNLAWAEIDSSRYEEARIAYARVLALYGYTDPVLERMLLYVIRTDKLFDVLPLQQHFMGNPKSQIRASTLAELGGYLLDKRLETPTGVPDENIERVEGIKDILLRAQKADPALPEPNYHLARYYNLYGASIEERYTLEAAAAAFDNASRETAKRTGYRIDNQRRLARLMTKGREFIPAERELVKAANIYEDAVNRGALTRKPEFGQIYADLGDLEYFAKEGALDTAARYYEQAERNGWLPPEIQYRLGNTYYRNGNYQRALERFFNVSRDFQLNRKLLFAIANAAYQNSNFSTAQAYYKMLLDILETEKGNVPNALPDSSPEHRALIERLMMAQNNMGVTLNALAARGKPEYRPRALVMFAEAIRAWDALERDQTTMLRPSFLELRLPGASRPYLNMQHATRPTAETEPQIFVSIDADVLEPSDWETLLGR